MELGTGCAFMTEMPNGDVRLQAAPHPDHLHKPYPEVLIAAHNIDAIIKTDLWYIVQVNRYISISDHDSGWVVARYFAATSLCNMRRI